MESLRLFFESWELFGDSVYAGVIAGALLGFLGVYIVVRRMVFLSAALSQTAGFGVTLAFLAQASLGASVLLSPTLGATAASLVAVFILMNDRVAQTGQRDAILGLTFLVGSAGTLAVGTRIVQEIQDVQSLLFGTAVAVVPADLAELAMVGLLLGVVHLIWQRGFTTVALDREDAMVRGLPVRAIEAGLLVSLAIAISVVTRILGALPAFAFSVLPAMAALQVAVNVRRAMLIAAVIGAATGFLGYLSAYLWDLPVGGSQTLVGAGFFVVFALFGRLR